MYESTDRGQRQQGHETGYPSTKPALRIIRRGATQYGWGHVKRVTAIRLLVAIWLGILASIFCALGLWWGALLFLPATLNGWLAFQIPRSKRALDAETDARLPREVLRSSR